MVVVRFNGGHQATHTVMRDGVKHSFSSFGSGTLLGIPSYFSEHCCFYPPSIHGEREDLLQKGMTPVLVIHPLAKLTTPYDIAYNRTRESRLKHGSVGVGIGATFERNVNHYRLHAADISLPYLMKEKLQQIRRYYQAKMESYSPDEKVYFNAIVEEEFKFFYAALASNDFTVANYNYLKQFTTIIFEGAQGIMLDMEFGSFPNVTYSHCTSRNALSVCNALNISDIAIHYVTRCYQTRHGNGWMSKENTVIENHVTLTNTDEEINVLGNWQGKFRIGEVDPELLNYAMNCDDIYSFDHEKHLHVTCLDQRPGFRFPYQQLTMPFKTIREQSSPEACSLHSFV